MSTRIDTATITDPRLDSVYLFITLRAEKLNFNELSSKYRMIGLYITFFFKESFLCRFFSDNLQRQRTTINMMIKLKVRKRLDIIKIDTPMPANMLDEASLTSSPPEVC